MKKIKTADDCYKILDDKDIMVGCFFIRKNNVVLVYVSGSYGSLEIKQVRWLLEEGEKLQYALQAQSGQDF